MICKFGNTRGLTSYKKLKKTFLKKTPNVT